MRCQKVLEAPGDSIDRERRIIPGRMYALLRYHGKEIHILMRYSQVDNNRYMSVKYVRVN